MLTAFLMQARHLPPKSISKHTGTHAIHTVVHVAVLPKCYRLTSGGRRHSPEMLAATREGWGGVVCS